jgi:hypothetical protein
MLGSWADFKIAIDPPRNPAADFSDLDFRFVFEMTGREDKMLLHKSLSTSASKQPIPPLGSLPDLSLVEVELEGRGGDNSHWPITKIAFSTTARRRRSTSRFYLGRDHPPLGTQRSIWWQCGTIWGYSRKGCRCHVPRHEPLPCGNR